jgi:hypothetical protein
MEQITNKERIAIGKYLRQDNKEIRWIILQPW